MFNPRAVCVMWGLTVLMAAAIAVGNVGVIAGLAGLVFVYTIYSVT